MRYMLRRRINNTIFLGLSVMAALFGAFWLLFIIVSILKNGFQAINWDLFFKDPAPPGFSGGGLRSAFVGQLIITVLASAIGVPIGILGGTFLSEYGRGTRLSRIVSDIADIMISLPSIVVGTFVYTVVVRPMGHFSGYAGAISLAIIMIPVILRSTEEVLRLVPWDLREAAFALGAPYHRVIMDVVYRSAAGGLFTGVILGIARVATETAPLLFTSFNNPFFSLNPNEAMPSLTVTIYQYAMGPYDDWHRLAWGASFVIVVFVLIVNISGRLFIRRRFGR
ncbi:phosphate ABC transporter permease PstA [Hippea sp. KM1]|uniref:phosphate ABC transporter permease PstA n=1 Tax=Hippea sp. KM1 TaxID=944481 RepID=UPI00046CFF6A|nr:phosphate ABC transporter permease PstA [Hippea sp. KM1]